MRISDWSSDVCSSDLKTDPQRQRSIPLSLQAVVPKACCYIDGTHLHAMFLRITDDLRCSVEAHGLRIQQRAGKDGRMMTFDPGGNIDQLGEGLRMAFGETVAAEPFNLLETAFGKIAFITALHHAADHLVLILYRKSVV